jgi:hypothetical protein
VRVARRRHRRRAYHCGVQLSIRLAHGHNDAAADVRTPGKPPDMPQLPPRLARIRNARYRGEVTPGDRDWLIYGRRLHMRRHSLP